MNFEGDWPNLWLKFFCSDILLQNIWYKVKKTSITGQDFKKMISTFTCLSTATVKVLFLKERLGTRVCLHLSSKIQYHHCASVDYFLLIYFTFNTFKYYVLSYRSFVHAAVLSLRKQTQSGRTYLIGLLIRARTYHEMRRKDLIKLFYVHQYLIDQCFVIVCFSAVRMNLYFHLDKCFSKVNILVAKLFISLFTGARIWKEKSTYL